MKQRYVPEGNSHLHKRNVSYYYRCVQLSGKVTSEDSAAGSSLPINPIWWKWSSA